MKKVFAILLVLAVVAGFVFAEEAAANAAGKAVIDVKTTIGSEYPAFKLTAASISTASGTISPADSKVAASNPSHGSVTVNTNDLLTKNAVIGFEVYQIKTARGASNYRLKVLGTDLVNDDYKTLGTENTLDDGEFFKYSVGTFGTETMAATSFVTVTAATSATENFSGYDGGYTVVYAAGSYLKATETAPVKLGSFAYTWTAKESAVKGDYSATVTLTVESF